jgi:hypothetical protein
VDDQEVHPDEISDEDEDPDLDDAESPTLRVALLSGVLAVLVVFGAVMTWLYLDRDRAVATKTAQLNADRTRLEELRHQADDLSAQLKIAQANALDPLGYQRIRLCVEEAYANRQLEREILSQYPDHLNVPPDAVTQLTISNPVILDPKTGKPSLVASPCDDAVKYLK